MALVPFAKTESMALRRVDLGKYVGHQAGLQVRREWVAGEDRVGGKATLVQGRM